MNQHISNYEKQLSVLCNTIKLLAHQQDFAECEKLIAEAMSMYPHAPQPHNLMGVLFEMKDEHAAAIKHFRAAWSLDPTYLPARHNLDNFASFYSVDRYAFDENDLL